MEPIIEVKNISKRYTITHEKGRYVALRDVLTTIIRKPFSFLAEKAKSAAGLTKKEEFWALKNVSFSIRKGEIVGIIGHNGAGKSTLLKILSQITPPTEGEIILRGRVGSLLEVGTGFHPELSGRENIFLNGAILGMTRREMASKFDQIVEFAGIEKFLDTPVKYYSSGMYVRLAFSVAAHMESDILLIDEVLAVGDAEFQKKCLGKMDEITQRDGRTIIFVSHNLGAIQSLCTSTILMKNGYMEKIGPTAEIINFYQNHLIDTQNVDLRRETRRRGSGLLKLINFHMEDAYGKKLTTLKSGDDAVFVLSYECDNPHKINKVDVGLSIDRNMTPVSTFYSSYTKEDFGPISSSGEFRFVAKKLPLAEGVYGISARVIADGIEADWPKANIGQIQVSNPTLFIDKNYRTNPASTLIINGSWNHKELHR